MGQENKFAVELEICGGLEMIEPLQMHPNHQIYERCVKILEEYFQEEDSAISFNDASASTGFNL
jgi:importin subunit alpha-6/7